MIIEKKKKTYEEQMNTRRSNSKVHYSKNLICENVSSLQYQQITLRYYMLLYNHRSHV